MDVTDGRDKLAILMKWACAVQHSVSRPFDLRVHTRPLQVHLSTLEFKYISCVLDKDNN